MDDTSPANTPQSPPAAADHVAVPPAGIWERLKHHKVLQWTLAYGVGAYTLLHGTHLIADAFDWTHVVLRVVALVLILGVPIVILLAWYHGHRSQHRVSGTELTILSALLVIAGTALWYFARPHETPTDATESQTSAGAVDLRSAPVSERSIAR